MAKRKPPRPKSTKNLPPGLKAYWASKGVPSTPGGAATASATPTGRKKSTVKRGRKKGAMASGGMTTGTSGRGRKKRAQKSGARPKVHVKVTVGGKTTHARA